MLESLQSVSPLVTLAVATTARPHRDRMILEAIRSFKGQADNDVEIFVLDNGSPPEETATLKRKLAAIKWARTLRIESLEHGSIPGSRNAIARMARGRYLCVVDDDDIALPNRLGDHLRSFEKDGMAHGSHGGWIDFDESTGVIERNTGKQRTIATLLRGTGKITAHPASFYRTDVMRAVPYDEAFALGSDFDLALRMGSLGFDIRHTNSFLTLRRYHSANVTITGQSNQVSNGLAARARANMSFSWSRQKGIEDAAKKLDGDVYCRNQMSIDSLAELIPGYTGTWQLFVPLSALSRDSARHAIESDRLALLAAPTEPSTANLAPALGGIDMDSSVLEKLLGLVDGEICTRQTGLNQPLYFRSAPITGLGKARRIRTAAEAVVRSPVQLNSVTQARLDRDVPFNWKAIDIKPGERVLQSERFGSLTDLLVAFGRIDNRTLLGKSLSILADSDAEGECYYLLTRPIRGYDELAQLRFELAHSTGKPFRHLAANGVENDLTQSPRSH